MKYGYIKQGLISMIWVLVYLHRFTCGSGYARFVCLAQSPMAWPFAENYVRRGSMSSDIVMKLYAFE